MHLRTFVEPTPLSNRPSPRLLALIIAGAMALAAPVVYGESTAGRQPIDLRLPALSLDEALLRLGQQAGTTIIVNKELTRGKTTPSTHLHGPLDNALRQLLQGTGLQAAPNPNNEGYRIESVPKPLSNGPVTLSAVTVQGSSSGTIGPLTIESKTSTKTDTPIVETPQSISVVNRELMDMLGATSASEAVRYSAGVSVGGYGTDSRVDEISVRGFRTGSFANNLYLDGLRPPGSSSGATASATQFDGYGLERVEILRGPSSVLYGQIAPGGLVNTVSKRPTDYARGEIGMSTDNYGLARLNADVSGPLDSEGKWLYRIVGTGYHTDTQVDHVELNRVMLAPSLTWRPSDRTSLTLLANYQQDRGGSTYQFLPSHGTRDATEYGRFGSNRFLGEPGFNRYDRTQTSIGYEFSHAFSDSIKVNQKLRYMQVNTDNAGVNRQGDLQSDGRTLLRSASSNEIRSEGLSMDTNAQFNFHLGATEHTLLTGLDYRTQTIRVAQASGTAQPLDVFEPVYGTPVTIGAMTPSRRIKSEQTGLYAQDQLRWNRWVATFGVRRDWSRDSSLARATGERSGYSDQATTWRAGLVYLFDNGFAPYVSYSTSFEPVNGVDYDGVQFKPTKGKQIEAGIKYQPPGSRSMITFSAYEIRQQNISTPAPDPTHLCDGRQCQVQTGEGRIRGLELEGNLAVSDNLSLIASATLMDGEVTKSNDTNLGNDLPRVPRHSYNLWLDYRFNQGALAGLSLGGGVRYTGNMYGDSANLYPSGSVTLFDAALRYDLAHLNPSLRNFKLSLNATNLADKEYVATCSGNASCYYGARRSVMASVSYQW